MITDPQTEPQQQAELNPHVQIATIQRKIQASALALQFHQMVSQRIMNAAQNGLRDDFVSCQETNAFNAACEHLRVVFQGENE